MKFILIFIFMIFSDFAIAAPTRFYITNEIDGRKFQITKPNDDIGEFQPEWGKPIRELPCLDVPENEKARIMARVTRDEKEYCTVKEQYSITPEDITAELAENARREAAIKTRQARMRALATKAKAGANLTAAETQETLRLLLLDFAKDMD